MSISTPTIQKKKQISDGGGPAPYAGSLEHVPKEPFDLGQGVSPFPSAGFKTTSAPTAERRPGAESALQKLCGEDRRATLWLSPEAPLLRHRLLELFDDPYRPHPPLLARYLKVDERVAAFLLGGDDPDSRLASCSRLTRPETRLEELVLDDETERRLQALAQSRADTGRVVYLQGPYGVGKKAVAGPFVVSMISSSSPLIWIPWGARTTKRLASPSSWPAGRRCCKAHLQEVPARERRLKPA